jgi:hypothetical protein
MINKSTPYYIDNNSDAWKWQIAVPYKFPKIIDIPQSTVDLITSGKTGIDGQEFTLVLDTNEFSKNAIVSVGTRQYGPRFYVIKDPQPFNMGYLYTFTLVTDNPTVDFVNPTFLQYGVELEVVDAAIADTKGWTGQLISSGNFDTSGKKVEKLQGLQKMRDDLENNTLNEPERYSSNSSKETLSRKINDAVKLAAQHYRIQKNKQLEASGQEPLPVTNLSSGYSGLGFTNEDIGKDTVNQFLQSIASGNLNSLSSVLAYFKRKVMH